MKKILISGANGFIATNFMHKFADKYNFVKLSHLPQKGYLTLDILSQKPEIIEEINYVINLAGTNIADKRWSKKRKQKLIDSRVNTTGRLIQLFNQFNPKAHFISASAVGIYNPKELSDENTSINYNQYTNFSQEITKSWEQAVLKYQGKLTITRFGVVLAGSGGAFPKMLKPFLFFGGGQLGNGTQYFPWIALPDLLNGLDYLIENEATGIYNLVAPEQINNQTLSQTIAKVWQRPNWLPLPTWLIKLIFGQMGEELFLNSLQVVPQKLTALNFPYQYPTLNACLSAIHTTKF